MIVASFIEFFDFSMRNNIFHVSYATFFFPEKWEIAIIFYTREFMRNQMENRQKFRIMKLLIFNLLRSKNIQTH